MSDRTNTNIFQDWSDAEREVWNAWSNVGSDLSQSNATGGCGHVLDAMETSVQQMARLNTSVMRATCQMMEANPFVPAPARLLMTQAYQPAASLVGVQQHLIAAWFGMARQLKASSDMPHLTDGPPGRTQPR